MVASQGWQATAVDFSAARLDEGWRQARRAVSPSTGCPPTSATIRPKQAPSSRRSKRQARSGAGSAARTEPRRARRGSDLPFHPLSRPPARPASLWRHAGFDLGNRGRASGPLNTTILGGQDTAAMPGWTVRNQRILNTWHARQAANTRRAAAGLPPQNRKRRRTPLPASPPPRHDQSGKTRATARSPPSPQHHHSGPAGPEQGQKAAQGFRAPAHARSSGGQGGSNHRPFRFSRWCCTVASPAVAGQGSVGSWPAHEAITQRAIGGPLTTAGGSRMVSSDAPGARVRTVSDPVPSRSPEEWAHPPLR